MSSRVYLFFPPRDHEPPPTLRDRLNPHLSFLKLRRPFPVPRYSKRPDVTLYAIGPLFLLPTPSSPHCILQGPSRFPQHDLLWQPPAGHHSDERPRPRRKKCCRAQYRLNALASGYLKGLISWCQKSSPWSHCRKTPSSSSPSSSSSSSGRGKGSR